MFHVEKIVNVARQDMRIIEKADAFREAILETIPDTSDEDIGKLIQSWDCRIAWTTFMLAYCNIMKEEFEHLKETITRECDITQIAKNLNSFEKLFFAPVASAVIVDEDSTDEKNGNCSSIGSAASEDNEEEVEEVSQINDSSIVLEELKQNKQRVSGMLKSIIESCREYNIRELPRDKSRNIHNLNREMCKLNFYIMKKENEIKNGTFPKPFIWTDGEDFKHFDEEEEAEKYGEEQQIAAFKMGWETENPFHGGYAYPCKSFERSSH